MLRSLLLTPLAITVASAATLAARQSTCACGYKDSNGAIWREAMVADFTGAAGAEAVVSQYFEKFNYEEDHDDGEYGMYYNASNVYPFNYGLALKTSAHSGSKSVRVQTAGIGTNRQNFEYGTFRMRAQIPGEPGVCFGFFLYKHDVVPRQEADIEFLTSDEDYYQRVYHTNHPSVVNGNTDNDAYKNLTISGADFTEFHEHRLDWLPGNTKYYYDGSLKSTVSKNSPTMQLRLIANVWSDGGPLWSRGPPKADAVATIYYIKGYFNSTTLSESDFNANCARVADKTPCSV